MSEYKLGKLSARVEVDRNHVPRYGPQDPVTGNVILTYHHHVPTVFRSKPAGTANLFVPIKIHVFLLGKIKITVRRDREIPTSHGMELFNNNFLVADSTFHGEAGGQYKFPFVACFPGDAANHEESLLLDDLPPSLSLYFSDYPDIVDAVVRYKLGCTVSMPGIDIKIQVPKGQDLTLVKYERPRPALSFVENKRSSFKQSVRLQNEYLLPEEERPHGFKQKAKAVFRSNYYPVLGLDIWLTHPWCIYSGQKMSLEVTVRKNDNDSQTTAPGVPEMALTYIRANLLARTEVDTSKRLMGSSQCSDTRRVVQSLGSETRLPAILSKQNEYAINLDMNRLFAHPSSFVHHKLERSYSLRFNLRFEVANKVVKMEGFCDVLLVPPPSEAYDVSPPAEAGPSRIAEEEEGLPPPTYQEAQGEAGSSKTRT